MYVGRPTDLNKGVTILFRAIKRVYNVNKNFITWIIGGDEIEIETLKSWIEKDDVLNEIHQSGKLMLWGRIINDALPEFYSRASICVMPSYNETFGMVAVEAMLCGCPVLASNTGGLKNVIKNAYSGFLLEPGNDEILFKYLFLLLTNLELKKWLSKNAKNWAKKNFTREATFSLYPLIYSNKLGNNQSDFHILKNDINRIQLIVKEELGELNNLENLSTSQHNVYENEHFVIKEFNEKLCSQSYLIFNIADNQVIHNAEELYNRSIFFNDFLYAPKILNYYNKDHIIIYEKLKKLDIEIDIEDITKLICAIKKFGETYSVKEINSAKQKCELLYKSKKMNTYNEYISIGNELNFPLTNGIKTNHRIHPQLDIKYSYEFYMRQCKNYQDTYWKELELVCKNLLKLDFLCDEIWLAQGEINTGHLFTKNNQIFLVDYETARYAFGELDIAMWLVNNYIWTESNIEIDVDKVVELSNRLTKSNLSAQLTILWMISEIIYKINRIHAYDIHHLKRITKYLDFIKRVTLIINEVSICI